MGEIADALRRASGARPGGRSPESGAPRSAGPPGEKASLAREPRDAALRTGESGPPQLLAAPTPTDDAIVVDDGPHLESCRRVALAVRGRLEARRARSLAVVSALRGEGKTTTSCNLALALASLSPGREIALLDLDLRRPSVARVLGTRPRRGIEEVLAGDAPLDDARIQIEQPPLDVYPALAPQRSAHRVLSRWRLSELMAELERRYAIVVVDTPPTLLLPDSRLILERVAVCMPVARAGLTRVRSFREMLETLPREQVLSSVLNGAKPNPRYYGGYDYGSDLAESASANGASEEERSG